MFLLQAGSIEGQVTEMGLTTTTLLNTEKFPVLVPNSMFSSQVYPPPPLAAFLIFYIALFCLTSPFENFVGNCE